MLASRAYFELVKTTRIAARLKPEETAEPGATEALIAALRTTIASLPVAPHQYIEVARERVKVIASNIRRLDLSWEDVKFFKRRVG